MAKSKVEIEWEKQKLILEYAIDTRKLEIQLFWQRSLFFWGFVAASLVAFATFDKPDEAQFRILVVCFGFLTSLAWTLLNRGSKYWQEAWEQNVEDFEQSVTGQSLFGQKPGKPLLPKEAGWRHLWLRARRFSVSKLAIAMSDLTVLLWLVIAGVESNIWNKNCKMVDWSILGPYLAATLIAFGFVFFGQSGNPKFPWEKTKGNS